MLRKEWSLISNSILIQLACGLIAFLAFYRQYFFDQAFGDTVIMAAACGMIWTGPIIFTAMILSLFHLGRPGRAYRAVSHLRVSWLSREVFFTGAFFVLWVISAWMDQTGAAPSALLWLTVAAGLLSVWSMSGIYAKTGRPGWAGLNPYLSFFGTFVVFGVISSSLILSATGQGEAIVPALPIFALFILIIRLLCSMHLFSTLEGGETKRSLARLVAAASIPLGKSITRLHRSLTLWGWCLSFAGVNLALYALTTLTHYAGVGLWITIAAFVLTGEILQRMGFNSLGLDCETPENRQGTRRQCQ